jgi:hypothetical protein
MGGSISENRNVLFATLFAVVLIVGAYFLARGVVHRLGALANAGGVHHRLCAVLKHGTESVMNTASIGKRAEPVDDPSCKEVGADYKHDREECRKEHVSVFRNASPHITVSISPAPRNKRVIW